MPTKKQKPRSVRVNIYFIHDKRRGAVKIGQTVAAPVARLASLQTGNSDPLDLIHVVKETFCSMESWLHMFLRPYQTDGGKEWFAEAPALALLGAFRWRDSDPRPVTLEPTYDIVESALAEIATRLDPLEAKAQVGLVCDVLTERLEELVSALRLPALPLKGWLLLDGMHMRPDHVGELAGEVLRAPEPFPDSGSLRDYLTRLPQRSLELCQAYSECFNDVKQLEPRTDNELPPWAARLPASRRWRRGF